MFPSVLVIRFCSSSNVSSADSNYSQHPEHGATTFDTGIKKEALDVLRMHLVQLTNSVCGAVSSC